MLEQIGFLQLSYFASILFSIMGRFSIIEPQEHDETVINICCRELVGGKINKRVVSVTIGKIFYHKSNTVKGYFSYS